MDAFFSKHHRDVEKLCHVLADEISDAFKIDRDDLGEFLESFLQKPAKIQCEGLVVSKNNTRCTCMAVPNNVYCKRHLYLKDQTSTNERPRCSGIMKRGVRCIHHATPNSDFCKKHKYQQDDEPETEQDVVLCAGTTADGNPCTRVVKKVGDTMCKTHLHKSPHMCAHYTLDPDNNELFICDRLSVIDKWCCRTHASMNHLYRQSFKAKCVKNYLEQVDAGTREEHPVLTDRYPRILKT